MYMLHWCQKWKFKEVYPEENVGLTVLLLTSGLCPSIAREVGEFVWRAKRAVRRRRRLVREADSGRGCSIFFGCSFFEMKSVWLAPGV